MTARPADEARRALREARERKALEEAEGSGVSGAPTEGTASGPAAEAKGSEGGGPVQGERREARPGDAARAALRRARSERRGVAGGDGQPERDLPEADGVQGAARGEVPEGIGGRREPAHDESGSRRESAPGQSGSRRESAPGQSGSRREPAPGQSGSRREPAPDQPGSRRQPAPGQSGSHKEPAPDQPRSEGVPVIPAEGALEPTGPDSAFGVGTADRAASDGAADRVREALRAARKEARRAQQEGAVEAGRGGRPAPRSTPVASGSPRGGRGDGVRARDLRALIGDAFSMPREEDEPTEREGGDSQAGHGGSADSAAALGATPPGAPTATPAPRTAPQIEPDTAPAPTWPKPSTPPAPSLGGNAEPHSPAASPHHPRSMAAPGRDGELRRTFPAFGPRAEDGEHGFAETWWGNAWVRALEEGALDAKRLARGRGYAEQGNVDAITVTPGLVLAYVQGSRPRPYRVQVRLRTLDDAEWQWFLDAAAERPGHIAALLDKEMPHSLAEGRVRLLPGPGELDPHCSCPDRGHPCKHAAALCYQTARLLDADPFVLLLLRGRGERELLDTLSRLSAARAARAAQEKGPAPLPGVRATEALAPRQLPPLPAPLPVPPHPEQPPVYPAAPGGPDPFALDQLATDAAARAHALLATGRDPVADLTLWQDAVRLAAARPGSGLTAATRSLYASLASAADRTPSDLARAVAAWRQGGFEGLAVLEEPWDPPAGRFDRARPLLLAADLPAFRPWRNRLTHPRGHVQLRLGRDGLWYAYESDPGADDWWPRGTPDLDPVGALTGLGASPES
ncbi:SWIM zinc finger family protein [Streptomyces justiciae]|uniref:SWIM zinc finger family protein n=1 Tax=Streptomyces justiciae TaxID=2780140 RepID=UPI0018806CB1|nr:SWIM zinc finger family protein [Streptomyces justiciae]MBE8476150.1 SWIM zinc finger family protein [Streptomyces justiciae]